MGQRPAFDVFHIEALLADQADHGGQLAGLVIHREEQRQPAAGGRGQRRRRVGAGDHQKAGGVVPVLIDAFDKDLQPIELGGLGRGDGRQRSVAAFGHMAGCVGGVAPGAGGQVVGFQERAALGQRLLMADDGADARQGRAGQGQQVLADGQVGHAGDGQAGAGIEQVHHGGHIPGVGVFKGEHAVLGVPCLHRVADIRPGGIGPGFGKGQKPAQRDVAPGPLHPLVGSHVPPQQLPLVRPGDRHGLLQKAAIIRAQGFVLQAGGVFVQHGVLPRRVKHRLAGGRLVPGHLPHRLHPLFKQRRHLGVDGVDLRPRLLQLIHRFPPSPHPGRTRGRSVFTIP